MVSWFPHKDPPLHTAVLSGQIDEIKKLAKDPAFLQAKNDSGFIAAEIAQLLDLKKALSVLQLPKHKTIKIMLEDDLEPIDCSTIQFEKLFGVKYLTHLKCANYAALKDVISKCPYILRSYLGNENRLLAATYHNEIWENYIADVAVKWIDKHIGYGLFAHGHLSTGAYIGEYTGIVRQINRMQPDHNSYCFEYPTRFWSWDYFVIDALCEGNEMRFINHSNEPNLDPLWVLDRGLLHMVFKANKDIQAGTQLTFNYGPDFWGA